MTHSLRGDYGFVTHETSTVPEMTLSILKFKTSQITYLSMELVHGGPLVFVCDVGWSDSSTISHINDLFEPSFANPINAFLQPRRAQGSVRIETMISRPQGECNSRIWSGFLQL